MKKTYGRLAVLFGLLAGGAQAGTVMYGIGPDGSGYAVGRRLFSIGTTTPGSPTWIDDVGPDSSRAVNGGLTYQAADSSFYGIANDSSGLAELISFALSSPYSTTDVAPLTAGYLWNGGLALGGGGLFYAIGTDAGTYVPSFFSVNPTTGVTTPLFAIGDGSLGYNGGLTFDPANGFFYALASGASESVLVRIGLDGSVTAVQSLGLLGYQGGVAYDASSGGLFALRTDGDAFAHLELITPGAGVSDVYDLWSPNNWGFWNAGLTFAPDGGGGQNGGGQLPEPATSGMAGMALACLCGLALKQRRGAMEGRK